jgi:hypothetical protein
LLEAIGTFSETTNADFDVQQFIWLLRPFEKRGNTLSFFGAVQASGAGDWRKLADLFEDQGSLSEKRLDEWVSERGFQITEKEKLLEKVINSLMKLEDLPQLCENDRKVVKLLLETLQNRRDLQMIFASQRSIDLPGLARWALYPHPDDQDALNISTSRAELKHIIELWSD